jgi:hypothetical protein
VTPKRVQASSLCLFYLLFQIVIDKVWGVADGTSLSAPVAA